jgi:hypothetical protein
MDHPVASPADRRQTDRDGPSPLADFLYDAIFGGTIGGGTVAVAFLVIDAIAHELLYTPSLLGSVLFLGVPPEAVTEVRMDMVAMFTVVHILTFATLGVIVSAMVQRLDGLALHPGLVGLFIFLFLETGVLAAEQLVMQGVIQAIGFGWITLANLLTGAAMGIVLLRAHREPDAAYRERSRAAD